MDGVNHYIHNQINISSTKTVFTIQGMVMVFYAIAALICFLLQLTQIAFVGGLVWAVSFIVFVMAFISKDKALLVLSNALSYTSASVVFLILFSLVVTAMGDVPHRSFVLGICVHIAGSVVSIIRIRKKVAVSTQQKSSQSKYGMLVGILGGFIGVCIVRVLLVLAGYQTVILLIAICCILLCLMFSLGSHLYQCFYWMKRYGYEKEL